MSTSASGAGLAALTKELVIKWQQTREYWLDDKARQFEERYMLELESTVQSAVRGIEQLDKIMTKIRSDCE